MPGRASPSGRRLQPGRRVSRCVGGRCANARPGSAWKWLARLSAREAYEGFPATTLLPLRVRLGDHHHAEPSSLRHCVRGFRASEPPSPAKPVYVNEVRDVHIPPRAKCFACHGTCPGEFLLEHQMCLRACRVCGAQWIEGWVPSHQAYAYPDPDTQPTMTRYHRARALRFSQYIHKVPIRRAGNLLDVGCGTGEFLLAAAAMGYAPVGIELTEAAAAVARTRTSMPVLVGNVAVEHLLPPSEFDVVTLWGVIEHEPDPVSLIRACARALRPHGWLLLETPNSQGLFMFVARLLANTTCARFQRPLREVLGAGHVVWLSALAVASVADYLGFRVVDLRHSANSTQVLLARFSGMSLLPRLACQAATATLNSLASPVGRPNQILAALQRIH